MAAPTPSQRPSTTSGSSATSWGRSGEPGSAFSGLSRGGRGRGGRGRGGRGGHSGNRESKPIGAESSGNIPSNTPTTKSTATPVTKPASLPAPPASAKAPAPPNAPAAGRPRGNPRRPSRSNPPVVAPSVSTDTPSTPPTSRPSNRRRRSQSGKAASSLSKINVPAHDDNLIRPHRPRMASVPHTAPIKDAPPHLLGSPFQKRADIDALVERVRAVAMDNRPNTPGSHIDWAGDDDDSLPDLDDWGVTPSKIATIQNELMSPLGVNGLRPLPGVVIDAELSPSHPKTPEPATDDKSNRPENEDQKIDAPANGVDNPDAHVATPITTTQDPLVSAPGSAKVSLRPSIPTDSAEVVETSQREETPTGKPSSEKGLAASIHSPNANANAENEDPFSTLHIRTGLAASIHAPAPSGISETKSAPSNISSYSTVSPDHRTHNRSHTIGRPPSYPSRPDNNHGRPSRSGYSSPRGGLSAGGGLHTRTHSTPPSGTHNAHRPRPVLTGDAITRLARTIGNTTHPTKVSTVSAAAE